MSKNMLEFMPKLSHIDVLYICGISILIYQAPLKSYQLPLADREKIFRCLEWIAKNVRNPTHADEILEKLRVAK